MEELSAEALFEKEYEDIMAKNEQEQNEFEAFFTRSEEDYKKNVLNTIDNYADDLDKLYRSNDRKLEDMLNKIAKKVND